MKTINPTDVELAMNFQHAAIARKLLADHGVRLVHRAFLPDLGGNHNTKNVAFILAEVEEELARQAILHWTIPWAADMRTYTTHQDSERLTGEEASLRVLGIPYLKSEAGPDFSYWLDAAVVSAPIAAELPRAVELIESVELPRVAILPVSAHWRNLLREMQALACLEDGLLKNCFDPDFWSALNRSARFYSQETNEFRMRSAI